MKLFNYEFRQSTRILKFLGLSFTGLAIVLVTGCGGGNGGGSGSTDGSSDGGTDGSGETAPVVSAEEFGDEFDSNSLNSWTLRHQTEGEAAQYTLLDINQTNSGMLTIEPTLTPGWFADGKAPLIYKRVTGNFSVETSVITQSSSDLSLPPGSNFNSAGLMARYTSGEGQNHVMINVGRQSESLAELLGVETKNTTSSNSALNLYPGSNNGRLILCRIGADFYAFYLLDNETEWTFINAALREDFPETVQLGLVVNGYTGPDLRATFDYVRMTTPETINECTPN